MAISQSIDLRQSQRSMVSDNALLRHAHLQHTKQQMLSLKSKAMSLDSAPIKTLVLYTDSVLRHRSKLARTIVLLL